MKRWLYLIHRWTGIALCLFMAMWFVSGIVMMYVGYPKLTDAERLATLPPLDAAGGLVPLQAALLATGESGAPRQVRLTTTAGAPRYVIAYDGNRHHAVDARSGRLIDAVDAEAAVAAAASYAGGEVRHRGVIDEDAWTHSRALDGHRPLRVLEALDGSSLYYVSALTGEVVRDASRTERIWNWLGAWIHWLYPFRGGVVDAQWSDIVIYSSLVATLLALTGIVIGVLRWRFRGRYKNQRRTPYREPYMRWHHLLGLVAGVLAATWIFSGLMSMNPWKIMSSGRPPLDTQAWSGGAFDAGRFADDIGGELQRLRQQGFEPRELVWRQFDGVGYLLAFDGGARTRLLPPRAGQAIEQLPADVLSRAGGRLLPGAAVERQQWLEHYDFHYYGRAVHTMTGQAERRLPVLRLEFNDPHRTWVHLDPYTAEVTQVSDSLRRIDRVLFALLHSWDWAPLLERRPLWDLLLIAGSAAGIAISLTGIVIGWRRLRRSAA